MSHEDDQYVYELVRKMRHIRTMPLVFADRIWLPQQQATPSLFDPIEPPTGWTYRNDVHELSPSPHQQVPDPGEQDAPEDPVEP